VSCVFPFLKQFLTIIEPENELSQLHRMSVAVSSASPSARWSDILDYVRSDALQLLSHPTCSRSTTEAARASMLALLDFEAASGLVDERRALGLCTNCHCTRNNSAPAPSAAGPDTATSLAPTTAGATSRTFGLEAFFGRPVGVAAAAAGASDAALPYTESAKGGKAAPSPSLPNGGCCGRCEELVTLLLRRSKLFDPTALIVQRALVNLFPRAADAIEASVKADKAEAALRKGVVAAAATTAASAATSQDGAKKNSTAPAAASSGVKKDAAADEWQQRPAKLVPLNPRPAASGLDAFFRGVSSGVASEFRVRAALDPRIAARVIIDMIVTERLRWVLTRNAAALAASGAPVLGADGQPVPPPHPLTQDIAARCTAAVSATVATPIGEFVFPMAAPPPPSDIANCGGGVVAAAQVQQRREMLLSWLTREQRRLALLLRCEHDDIPALRQFLATTAEHMALSAPIPYEGSSETFLLLLLALAHAGSLADPGVRRGLASAEATAALEETLEAFKLTPDQFGDMVADLFLLP
jgi:hypothetical protein